MASCFSFVRRQRGRCASRTVAPVTVSEPQLFDIDTEEEEEEEEDVLIGTGRVAVMIGSREFKKRAENLPGRIDTAEKRTLRVSVHIW